MSSTIKISDAMAQTMIECTIEKLGKRMIRLASTRMQTVTALISRGLITDGPDWSLTPRGLNVRERLLAQPDGREFLASVVDAAGRKEVPVTPEPVTEYSVKIWYRSGAYEGAPHCPEELARKIFADAVASAGVEFAELHGPSGKLVESKTPNEESPVTTEPEQPTENLFLAGLPLLHPEPLPPAPELPTEPEENTGG